MQVCLHFRRASCRHTSGSTTGTGGTAWERDPHRLAQAQPLVEGVGEPGLGEDAAVDALHAAHAQAFVDVSRLRRTFTW